MEKITADSGQLGRNIEVIDSAMKEVEKSNTHLVENMEQVSGVVETMTDRISHSDETTKTHAQQIRRDGIEYRQH